MTDEPEETTAPDDQGRILSVHVGHSANCSSIGSVIDFLFVSSVVSGALLSAIALMLKDRKDPPRDDPKR